MARPRPNPKRLPQRRRRVPRWVWPVLAVVLTFGLRLWFILEMRGHPFSAISAQYVDAYYYHQWALDITNGNFLGSEVFFLRPLYPYLLALVYTVFGAKVLAVQLLQVLLATASCLLLWDTTRRMFNRSAAAVAALGFAFCGVLAFYTGTLLYVELTAFLALFHVWLVIVAHDRWWRWLLAGLTYGLLVICRPELLVLAPFCLVLLWRMKTAGRHLVLLSLAAAAVIAIVPLRNQLVAGEPVLFTAHSGVNFYYANNPAADGTWQPTGDLAKTAGFSHRQLEHSAKRIEGQEVSWTVASRYWMNKAFRFITDRPLDFARLVGRKFLLFWSDYEVPSNYYPETARASSLALRLAFINFALVAAFGVIGLVLAWPWRGESWPAYLLVAGFLFSALVFYVLSRLRAPVIPFLLLFGGFGATELVRSVKQKRWGRVVVGLVGAGAVAAASLAIPVDRKTYSSQAWTQLGNIRLANREPKQASTAFNRAIKANPDNPLPRYSLLVTLASAGRTDEAVEQYRRIERIAARDPASRVLADLGGARIAIARRDFPAAVRGYRAAIDLDPENAETWYLLGLVYVSMDSLPAARTHLRRALELDANHSEARRTFDAVQSRLRRSP